MGWFDDQIKQRKSSDNDEFSNAFVNITNAISGGKVSEALGDKLAKAKNAYDEILKFYHVKSREIPENIKETDEQLDFLMHPYGIMQRTVKLSDGWYKDAIGAMLGFRKDDESVVAFIPTGISGYSYYDYETGKKIKINKKNQHIFKTEAIAFYKPFPLKKLNTASLIKYIIQTISVSDIVLICLATLTVSLVGMITPKIDNLLFSDVILTGSTRLLVAITIFMVCTSISILMFSAIKSLVTDRINTKMSIQVEAATMMRVLSLPADFFKQYSSGELSCRSQYINSLCQTLVSTVFSSGLTSLFSLVYITQIFIYAPGLVIPALSIILTTVVLSVVTTIVQMNISKKQMKLAGKESGMSYALISGIQKIKLTGAEKRAFSRWSNLYSKQVKYIYNPPVFIKINSVISTAISLVGTLVMYYAAIKTNVSIADYYAFNTSYAMVSGAFISLAGVALSAAQIKPMIDSVKPILETVPEVSEGKRTIAKVSGGMELNNVSFRYDDSMPPVINNLSLKIRPGQYVAIVGKTGCGKSTLLRLMLGFEKAQKGAIYYDGNDINSIDLKSLRQKIGVVMQNGKLFQGDIFSNISISAPSLTLDEAWEAAELAGIAEDIRHMPMGMNTIISEGSGGVSGGQRQRLMIARAIAPKPKILMFDEATSALDNLTQKKVSESLNALKNTRIVIAHRLSTIRHCDRIIVLDNGSIVEDGTYEELIRKNGFFAELVERQRLDEPVTQ